MSKFLFHLGCQLRNKFKDNFHTLYGKTPLCKCEKAIDSQSHDLACELFKRELTCCTQHAQQCRVY